MMTNLEVLYEDNHIIVVFKPSNILSQGDITGDIDMLTIIKNYLKEKYHKPGNVFLGLVHRLDRPVEGVMVFAKTSKAAARLSLQIRKNEMSKHYYAIINGYLDQKEGTFKDYLYKDAKTGNTYITTKDKGKEAILNYKVIKEKDNYSLVDIELISGRHHQIRVQFASRKHPLLGDSRYGTNINKNISLCCYSLSFYHPISKELLNFKRLPKNNDNWNIFF